MRSARAPARSHLHWRSASRSRPDAPPSARLRYVADDAVDAALAKDVRAGLEARRAAIVGGTLAPFAAPLVDNTGTTRLARGALADAEIKAMDWFVAGVVGNVPKAR